MAALIKAQLVQSGFSCYTSLLDKNGNRWNGTSFEAYNSAHWSTYAITMTEQVPTGFYQATFPPSISPGKYMFVVFNNATPANTDSALFYDFLQWDGSNEVLTISTTDVLTQVNTALNTVISSATPGSILDEVNQIFLKLPSGSISGFNRITDPVNLSNNQSGVTIGTVNNLGSSAAATVLSQLNTLLNSNTIPELSGVPASTPTLMQAIMFLYMALRNNRTSTATTVALYNASGAMIAAASQSDNGIVYTKGNFS